MFWELSAKNKQNLNDDGINVVLFNQFDFFLVSYLQAAMYNSCRNISWTFFALIWTPSSVIGQQLRSNSIHYTTRYDAAYPISWTTK